MSDTIAQFDFGEALTHLRAGKRVRRLGWPSRLKYFEMRTQDDISILGTLGGPTRVLELRRADILATDWVLVEEEPETADAEMR